MHKTFYSIFTVKTINLGKTLLFLDVEETESVEELRQRLRQMKALVNERPSKKTGSTIFYVLHLKTLYMPNQITQSSTKWPYLTA